MCRTQVVVTCFSAALGAATAFLAAGFPAVGVFVIDADRVSVIVKGRVSPLAVTGQKRIGERENGAGRGGLKQVARGGTKLERFGDRLQ